MTAAAKPRIVMLILDGRHVSTIRSAEPLAKLAAELLDRNEDATRAEARYQSAGSGRWLAPGDSVTVSREVAR